VHSAGEYREVRHCYYDGSHEARVCPCPAAAPEACAYHECNLSKYKAKFRCPEFRVMVKRYTLSAVFPGFQGWRDSRNSGKSARKTDRNGAHENACMQRTKSWECIISVSQAGRLMVSEERRSAEAYLKEVKLLRVCTKG